MRAAHISAWVELPQPFLPSEALAAGLGKTALAGAIRRRHVIRVTPSLYAAREPWLELTAKDVHRALTRPAQQLVAGSVVSHASAAVLHGFPAPQGPLGKVSLTVNKTSHKTSRTSYPDDWRRVLHGALPDEHIAELDGIPLTTPARTVVDCFRQHRLRNALAIADGALRAGLTTVEELREMRAFQKRWPGIRLADEGLALADGRRESWLESASVAVASRRGFSTPESQVHLHTLEGEFVARVDLLWRSAGVIGECDGRGKYQGEFAEGEWDAEAAAAVMVAERERERGLEQIGFAVGRWGTSGLRNYGEAMVAELQAARRRAAPDKIRCLWRVDEDEPLREWTSFTAVTSGH
jgi:hypothetical protein